MQMTADIWNRFKSGVIPDDEELRCVIQFLMPLEESLRFLSEQDRAHHFSWVEVSSELRRANGYADSRHWARLHKVEIPVPPEGMGIFEGYGEYDQ